MLVSDFTIQVTELRLNRDIIVLPTYLCSHVSTNYNEIAVTKMYFPVRKEGYVRKKKFF